MFTFVQYRREIFNGQSHLHIKTCYKTIKIQIYKEPINLYKMLITSKNFHWFPIINHFSPSFQYFHEHKPFALSYFHNFFFIFCFGIRRSQIAKLHRFGSNLCPRISAPKVRGLWTCFTTSVLLAFDWKYYSCLIAEITLFQKYVAIKHQNYNQILAESFQSLLQIQKENVLLRSLLSGL